MDRFAKAITLYSLVAVRILFLLHYERLHPDADAAALFSPQEVCVLAYQEGKASTNVTLHEAMIAVAKLGGYLARGQDGPPGIKALWIGYQRLQDLVAGMQLAREGDVGKD